MITLKNQIYYYDLEDSIFPVVKDLNVSDPNWILYNGIWNDNGTWYDTSYWNDGFGNIEISTSVKFSGTNSLKLPDMSASPHFQTPFFNIKSTRANPVKISSWVYTTDIVSTTNLCGVGIFNDQNVNLGSNSTGYYAVVDVRSGTGSTAGFQLRKTSGTTILDSETVTISSNTWYKVELYIEDDNIVAKLYNTDLDLLATLTSDDSDYATGYFSLMSYEEAYFDEIHVLGDKEVSMTSLEWMNGYEEYYYELSIVNPSDRTQTIAYINDYTNLNIRPVFNEVNEIEFILPYYVDVDMSVNSVWSKVYEDVELVLTIKIDDMIVGEESYVVDTSELLAGDKECKRVHAYTKEYKLGKKKIRGFNKSVKLYDSTYSWQDGIDNETDDAPFLSGILNYIIEVKLENTWTVSYMSSSLEGEYRLFNITNKSVLEVIRDIQEQFDCVVLFDSKNYTISIKTYDEAGTNKGLILDIDNYIKTLNKKIKIDEIVTRLYVDGDKGAEISGKNITGQSYLDDFSFFRNTNYMSQSLIDALDAYDIVKSNNSGNFSTYLSNLSTAQAELLDLQNNGITGLIKLNSNLKIIKDHLTDCITLGGVSDGQTYSYWKSQESTTESAITAKELEITNKEIEIAGIEANIAIIVSNVSYENNFTIAQLQELNNFIYEDVVKCNTEDTDVLIEYGQQVLSNRATPPIEFSVELVDVFSAKSEQFCWNKLSLGDLVNVTHEEFEIDTEVRVMGYNWDVDGSTLSIDFSNKEYLNSELNYLNDIIRKSKQNAEVLEENEYKYDDYYDNDKDTINDFITSPINTDDNEVLVGGGITLSRSGIIMKDINDITGQMALISNKIVFTQDEWQSYSVAITPEGIQTTGEFKLFSENEYNGNSVVNINGSGIKIYGSETAGEGLIIFNKDDEEVFSLDTSGNISMTGNITITGGNTGDLAFLNQVGASNCDTTIISGGKIITGLLTADNIQSGTISTVSWDGTGNDYITMGRQIMLYKEYVDGVSDITQMAMGFLPDHTGENVPTTIYGAGAGNDSSVNKGYITKTSDAFNLFYVDTANSAQGISIKSDGVYCTSELKLDTALATTYLADGQTFTDKLQSMDLNGDFGGDVFGTINGTNASTVVSYASNGNSAWSKFSGSGNTLPSGNVEFNFAGSNSKGGNANNTDSVGTQSANTVQSATINFNSRNDRKSTTPANPTITTDALAVDHTINDDGSSDISFEWQFSGVGDAYDIDGFIVYIYQSSSSSTYTFGTTEESEQIFYVTPEKRAFILYGIPANKYYTFGVQAYRIVDTDVNSDNVLKSSIVKPSLGSENPYRPSSSVAFNGNITGTIDGESAGDVKNKLQKMNTSGNFGVELSGARIELSNTIIGKNSSNQNMGLYCNPINSDLTLYYNGNEHLKLYNELNGSSSLYIQTNRIGYGDSSGFYADGNWDFSGATSVSGIVAKFA